MRYQMKQKLFAFGDDYTIQNETGQDEFFVDGHMFSLRSRLDFRDLAGNELARIQRKLLAWGPTYEIYSQGQMVAEVRKHLFTFFKARFTVDVPGPDDLEAQGSFLDYEYTFTRHGSVVASVSKKWFSFRDSYGIDIADGEDPILILCSAVVIDQVCHESRKD